MEKDIAQSEERREFLRTIAGSSVLLSLRLLFGSALTGLMADPALAEERDETFHPYVITLPSASNEKIYEALLKTAYPERVEPDFSRRFQQQFSRLYRGGRKIHIAFDPLEYERQKTHFKRVREEEIARMARGEGIGLTKDSCAMDMRKFLTPDDPVIKKLALEITRGIQTPEDKLQALLLFVQHLDYFSDPPGNIDYPAFPLQTLARRGGDCEDRCILFASLALSLPETRELGIEFVYLFFLGEKIEWDIAVGVSGGKESRYQIGPHRPQRIQGLLIGMPTIPGRFFGHPGPQLQEMHIKKRLKVS